MSEAKQRTPAWWNEVVRVPSHDEPMSRSDHAMRLRGKGYTNGDVAFVLGTSTSAVRCHVARRRIRERLQAKAIETKPPVPEPVVIDEVTEAITPEQWDAIRDRVAGNNCSITFIGSDNSIFAIDEVNAMGRERLTEMAVRESGTIQEPSHLPVNGPNTAVTEENDSEHLAGDSAAYLGRENARLRRQVKYLLDATDAVCETVEAAIEKRGVHLVTPMFPTESEQARKGSAVAMLELSDSHAGAFISTDELGHTACGYSWPEFEARAGIWIQDAIRRIDAHRAMQPVDVLEVIGLGDYIENQTIFPTQGMQTDAEVMEQVYGASQVIAGCLKYAFEYGRFRTIRFRHASSGNHGRPGHKGANHPETNWDVSFATELRSLCRIHGLPVEFYIGRGPFMMWRVPEAPDFVFAGVHGDTITRGINGAKAARRDYITLTGVHVDYLLIADKHVAEDHADVIGRVITNGNWPGGSNYSVGQLRTAGHASQNLLMLDPAEGITANHTLYLHRQRPMEPDANGMYTPTRPEFRPRELPAPGYKAIAGRPIADSDRTWPGLGMGRIFEERMARLTEPEGD